MNTKTAIASALILLCSPAASFAGTSADIEATGSSPAFCDISNTGGPISMAISTDKATLSGAGSYEFLANGDAKVTISALTPVAPQGAAAYSPSLSLANLVTNTSTTAIADSPTQAGTNRITGAITTTISQNNSQQLLSAGSYSLAATATCTAL
jgi:hypothetical protein